ncbi:polyphosphate kinase 1 [Siphonobacter sp.]|uniref:polyphosphate kinase 1 n=1 Tax=Siphonobacter sp. TaxID=1869184 RepID=UPI003B3B9CF2
MEDQKRLARSQEKVSSTIEQSPYLSRDLSWLAFNERVLDQVRNPQRTLFDRLKFLAITASNLDEFFSIRLGSLYNYLDYKKERIDYSGLREWPFRQTLLTMSQQFYEERNRIFREELLPLFPENELRLASWSDLTEGEAAAAIGHFDRTIFPMLTPMVYDQTHTFPSLIPRTLTFAVVTKNPYVTKKDQAEKKLSFIQIPQNLPRFFVIDRVEEVVFLPMEEIVRHEIHKLYRNIEILNVSLLRIIRNGDFSVDDIDDVEDDIVDEIRQKVKNRRLGRVVKVAVEPNCSEWVINILKKKWEIDDLNIFYADQLIDFTSMWQVIRHPEFRDELPKSPSPVPALGLPRGPIDDIFSVIRERDIFLHHPYNNFEAVLQLLEQAAEDPNVLSIKLTVYRVAKNSRVTAALLKAAENGKNVAVLFEVKARFDEENNIREAERLQKAGCFVIYGIGRFKTHTKLLLIVRAEGDGVKRYAHLSSGNYNEDTAKLYTDVGLLTANEVYTSDVAEFFNVITGHSLPSSYQNLITAPGDMRNNLIELIRAEAANAKEGKPSGICLKINSLEDRETIDELYLASQAGVPIKLIVRGICCLRPGREGLSENITVRSIVGDFLEHTRLFYFHNEGEPKIYGGSADLMVRSFDKRIESLFLLVNPKVQQQAVQLLEYNMKDNVNAYTLKEDGTYAKCPRKADEEVFNIHEKFFEVTEASLPEAQLF